GASVNNTPVFLLDVASGLSAGTPIELALQLTTSAGSATLLTTIDTGTPVATTIFSQNFDGVSPGTLPPGWNTVHVGGSPTVPWTTNNTFMGSNALFHEERSSMRFERVFSPSITVPNVSA